MPDKFTHRSVEKELLDEADIPAGLLFKNLRELDILNRTTGGHAISLTGIKQLVTDPHKTYHIADLGCGSGDALKVMADWARSNNYNVKLTGVDRNPDVIGYLKDHCAGYPEITGIAADYQEYLNENRSIDVVHCSLFCHHLTDDELTRLFTCLRKNVVTGFVINDLQRQWLAYYSAWFFTRFLNGTELSKNDGPVSVLRGFRPGEIEKLFAKVGITQYTIRKKWLFRYLIVGKTEYNGPIF